jgi:hypothetical protein
MTHHDRIARSWRRAVIAEAMRGRWREQGYTETGRRIKTPRPLRQQRPWDLQLK